MSQWFTIVRLMPRRLSLNGSGASAEIIARLLQESGHRVAIADCNSLDEAPSVADLVAVGSTSSSHIVPAAKEMISLVRSFDAWRKSGTQWFAVGAGWDLLGQQIVLADGENIPGAGIFPSEADYRSGRFIGEVQGIDYRGRPCAGYVNQLGSTELHEGVDNLLAIDSPREQWATHDGLRAAGLFATKLGGPALALNPHWAMDVVEELLSSRGLPFEHGQFHNHLSELAEKARRQIVERLGATQ